MSTTPQQPTPAPTKASGIESFVTMFPGNLIVAILTFITRITVMKKKDAQGKTVEKTPLDTVKGTVISGFALLAIIIVLIRIATAIW